MALATEDGKDWDDLIRELFENDCRPVVPLSLLNTIKVDLDYVDIASLAKFHTN